MVKKNKKSLGLFDDEFQGGVDFDKMCDEADKEIAQSGGMPQPNNSSNAGLAKRADESDEDMKKKWKLGDLADPSFKENLSDGMTTLEEKLSKLLDTKTKTGKIYEEQRKKAAKDKIEKAKRMEHEHEMLPDVMHMLKTIGCCYLAGPAGTGKSTLAKSACKKLFDLKDDPVVSGKYAQISFSPDTTSGEMIGRSDVNGNFHESEIVRVFRDGGLILFDEIDDADAAMLIKINTALANGYLSTPNGMVVRNKDTYICCAANTYGTGPDAMYVGRTRLDAATLDRFTLCTVFVDYDKHLEDEIADQLDPDNHYWLTGYVSKVREAIKKGRLRKTCSTRFVINATAHMLAGKTPRWIQENYLQNWTVAEKAKLKAIENEVL